MKRLMVIIVLMVTASSAFAAGEKWNVLGFLDGLDAAKRVEGRKNRWNSLNEMFGRSKDLVDCRTTIGSNVDALDMSRLMFMTRNTPNDESIKALYGAVDQ